MEYVFDELWQTVVLPEIVPGCVGTGETVTDKVLGVLLPQLLFAVTEIVPPELPAVAVMEVDVELPDQPEGKVHM